MEIAITRGKYQKIFLTYSIHLASVVFLPHLCSQLIKKMPKATVIFGEEK